MQCHYSNVNSVIDTSYLSKDVRIGGSMAMAVTRLCICCKNSLKTLETSFEQGDESAFFEIWDSMEMKDVESTLSFEMRVYFATFPPETDDRINNFTKFLQEKGSHYSKFPELAPYYALPYIKNNSEHPLLCEIKTEEWKEKLRDKWTRAFEEKSENCHKIDDTKLTSNLQRYTRLKTKYSTLRKDYKALLELATQLTKALENALKNGTECVDETVENYYEKISTFAKDYGAEEAENGSSWRWEASTLSKCESTESIASEQPTQ